MSTLRQLYSECVVLDYGQISLDSQPLYHHYYNLQYDNFLLQLLLMQDMQYHVQQQTTIQFLPDPRKFIIYVYIKTITFCKCLLCSDKTIKIWTVNYS